ncbi:MAG: N-acetylmuramoyl-L-alanine amidase [Eubacteriales bacterium]
MEIKHSKAETLHVPSDKRPSEQRKQTLSAALFVIKFFMFTLILALCTAVCGTIFRSCAQTASAGTGDISVISESGADFIVDPGHGGRDGGASAADGTVEKELNLALAAVLRDTLDILGYDAVMTRTDDLMLSDSGSGTNKMRDLRARLNIAKANPDALFISIHMNKFPDPRYSGLQVWYSPNHPSGQKTAQIIQAGYKTYISPENNREIKAAGSNIFLLDRIKNPAVLVECGFLSNASETKRLSDSAYQKKLALVIAVTASEAHSFKAVTDEQIKK